MTLIVAPLRLVPDVIKTRGPSHELTIIGPEATPPGTEDDIAKRLRTASPTATPNLLMVALADDILKRDGAKVMAVKRIGRGADAMEGVPFDFAL